MACPVMIVWGLLLCCSAATARGPAATGEGVVHAAADVFQSDRVDMSDAVPVRRPRRDVSVSHAVHNGGELKQVAYFEGDSGYGPAVFESTCGCETVCDCPVGGGFAGPGCGIEASCGLEPACGTEVWGEPTCGCDGVGCDTCCNGYDPTCGCNACCGGIGGFIDCLFPRLRIQWAQLDLFAGVAGHTGPMNFANISATGTDRRGTGSFGFYEGFNKGVGLRFFGTDMAWQSGVRFTQNNLSGAGFTDETRGQIFLTSGIFRTVDYGFQYGLVLDYLYEDWYYRSDLVQLRGELGWVNRSCNVFGLKFAVGVDDDTATTSVLNNSGAVVRNDIELEAMTQYRLFYRHRLARLGSCESFVGWTDNDDGLLGMELDLPVHGNLLWNTSATYLIPNEGTGSGGNQQEGWNLAIGFTYRPGGLGAQSRYSRPLLKVADNGLMMVDRK